MCRREQKRLSFLPFLPDRRPSHSSPFRPPLSITLFSFAFLFVFLFGEAPSAVGIVRVSVLQSGPLSRGSFISHPRFQPLGATSFPSTPSRIKKAPRVTLLFPRLDITATFFLPPLPPPHPGRAVHLLLARLCRSPPASALSLSRHRKSTPVFFSPWRTHRARDKKLPAGETSGTMCLTHFFLRHPTLTTRIRERADTLFNRRFSTPHRRDLVVINHSPGCERSIMEGPGLIDRTHRSP